MAPGATREHADTNPTNRNHTDTNPADGWYDAELTILSHDPCCSERTDGQDCPQLADARRALSAVPPRPDLSAADPAVLRRAVMIARGILRRHSLRAGQCRICGIPGSEQITVLITAAAEPIVPGSGDTASLEIAAGSGTIPAPGTIPASEVTRESTQVGPDPGSALGGVPVPESSSSYLIPRCAPARAASALLVAVHDPWQPPGQTRVPTAKENPVSGN